jgi:hypothetical protein
MGQCGQGHTSTPVTKPKKVIGLEGVSIQQITAGTSHSLAWTAVPTDRYEGGVRGLCSFGKQVFIGQVQMGFYLPVSAFSLPVMPPEHYPERVTV